MRKFAYLVITIFVSVGLTLTGLSTANADTGAPPNGQNLGFRYLGSPTNGGTGLVDGTLNTYGAFMLSDGIGLDLCGMAPGNIARNCGFDFKYSISGTQYVPLTQASAFTYTTWPTITDTNKDDKLCTTGGGNNNGPYTNFNCFNTNTYGQTFKPAASGAFSGFSMAMTCMSSTGSTIVNAGIYESTEPTKVAAPGADATIATTPLATTSFTMTGCDTSWSGKTFTDADFTFPTMDFGSLTLDSAKWYTVVFSGEAVAGAKPTGLTNTGTPNSGSGNADTAKPTLATGSTTPSINSGTKSVETYTANKTVTWKITGGTNKALFTIDSKTGKLTFNKAAKAGTYVVQITATDSTGVASDPITVTVTVKAALAATGFDGSFNLALALVATGLLAVLNARRKLTRFVK